jgi:RNA polymerase sigma factor (sigma-70 family)
MADPQNMATPGNVPGSITELFHQVRAGDEDALGPFLDRYLALLRRFFFKKLSGVDRGAVDESDLALAAARSFLSWAVSPESPELGDREDIRRVLFKIALRKWLKVIEKQGRRGHVVQEATLVGADGSGGGLDALAASGPEPVDEVIGRDLVRRCMEMLDEQQQRIVELRLHGVTVARIAEELGVSRISISRSLRRIREAWESLLEEGE